MRTPKRLIWLRRHWYKRGVTASSQAVLQEIFNTFGLRHFHFGKETHDIVVKEKLRVTITPLRKYGYNSLVGKASSISKCNSRGYPKGKADFRLFSYRELLQQRPLKIPKGWFLVHRSPEINVNIKIRPAKTTR